jgi:hypothetical protein
MCQLFGHYANVVEQTSHTRAPGEQVFSMACMSNGTRVEILLRNSTHRAIVLPTQYFRLKVIENHGHPALTASPRTSRHSVYKCFEARLAFGTSFRDGTVFLILRMTEWPTLPQRVVSELQ